VAPVVTYLAACVVFSAVRAEAGSFEINAWAFDRGNAQVYPNPEEDAHVRLLVGDGCESPWVVEYDVDFPVAATYTLHVRYASAESRPVDVLLDGRSLGKCCSEATSTLPLPVGQPEHPWKRGAAKWEEVCRFSVTEGKHTLKLTRKGPPPYVIALRFQSPAAFPKGGKPAGPSAQGSISSIEARRGTASLPPGSVNIATLRLALVDMIAEFGPQYIKGPQYLRQLTDLEKRQNAARGGTPQQKQESEDALKLLRREAMLSHPLLKFDKLLFVKRMTYTSSHIYSDHWDGSRKMGGNLCILSPVAPDGNITELAPELTGGLFGHFDLSFDAKKVVFAYKRAPDKGYRIFEVGIDGSGLRQLTSDADDEPEAIGRRTYRYEDLDPCYLADGKIMFTSTRSKRRVFCFPSTVASLFVMDGHGKNRRCVSGGPVNEFVPCLMGDGRVLYTRWEYVDKGFGNVQSLWSMRPDGSASAHVYKSYVAQPAGMIDARRIPGSSRIVTIAVPHCGLSVGPVIVVDNRVTQRKQQAMTNITPEIGYPDMFAKKETRRFGYFKEPYPLSEKLFLVSHNPSEKENEPAGYGIYVLDWWGNRAELYRDGDISCFQPVPLRPRPMPTQIPSVADMDETIAANNETNKEKPATLFMQDVYRGMTGIERGRVKYLRVMEAEALSWDDSWRADRQQDGAGLQAAAVSFKGDVGIKRVHGVVKVHEDGSACFTVPVDTNLFFQALDEEYMELQRMRTFVNLRPGETRSCIGCHELRRNAPELRDAHPLALEHPVQALLAQPGDAGPRTVHYARDVQPILDKRCIGCHGGRKPQGELALTGEPTTLWNRSYENLINKHLISNLNGGHVAANVPDTPPLAFGSHRSKLVTRIRKDPCKANLTGEEFIRIVTWIDANAPYYGTHEGKKNLKWKDEPDFRPLPLVRK